MRTTPTAKRMELHPALPPFDTGMLPVGNGHSLYWETVGSPQGVPVVMLHGGPGAGCSERDRRLFDPERTYAVLFDQRGAGRSTPSGSIDHNNTCQLVADIERLRNQLGIEQWWVFGGSWGTTLALAYGQAHPQRCLGFVLRGTWLYTHHEVQAMFGPASAHAPDWHAELFRLTEASTVTKMLGRAHALVQTDDPTVHGPIARALLSYEWELCDFPPLSLDEALQPENLAMARIGLHYQIHLGFLREAQLLNGMTAIQHLPGWIIHGEQDRVCPLSTAQTLHALWPGSRLRVVPGEGHADSTPGMQAAVMETLARIVGGAA